MKYRYSSIQSVKSNKQNLISQNKIEHPYQVYKFSTRPKGPIQKPLEIRCYYFNKHHMPFRFTYLVYSLPTLTSMFILLILLRTYLSNAGNSERKLNVY